MKKLIFILVAITLSQPAYSQTTTFLPKSSEFSKEFVRLVDSARAAEFGLQVTNTYNKVSRKWVNISHPFNTQIDSAASLACAYHNNYMFSLVKGLARIDLILTHTEKSKIDKYPYTGTDTLLYSFIDRCNYFCGAEFNTYGECIWGGYTEYKDCKNITSQGLARLAFIGFMKSKGHHEILMGREYTNIGINLMVDSASGKFWITLVTGEKIAKI